MMQRDPNAIDRHVATRLRAARNLAKLSQDAASAAIGVSFQQLQKYEKGVNRITLGRLLMLLEVYGVELDFVLSGAPLLAQSQDPVDDPSGALIALPGGADLARTLARLTPGSRHVVKVVAEALT
jgi:transcriptional regulator with XRE-family HTH domain